jgi:hypothetical protein
MPTLSGALADTPDERAKAPSAYDVTLDGRRLASVTGAALADRGLELRLPAIWRAGVVELEAQAATHSPS